MKYKTLVLSILSIALLSLTAEISPAKVYVAEPYLVQQPPYAGMTFYVHRPYGMPDDWYLTFDGYAVAQTQGEIWVYGTMQAGALVKTNYIVGSVDPNLTNLVPYSGANSTNTWKSENKIIIRQPLGAAPGQTAKQIYIPDWSLEPKFLAISDWKSTVDRIGLLYKHNIPLAWKGDRPAVIYAWLGKNWRQIDTRRTGDTHHEDILRVINLNLYKLLREREKGSRYRWYAEDIPVLAEKTVGWGYLWMGEIYLKN